MIESAHLNETASLRPDQWQQYYDLEQLCSSEQCYIVFDIFFLFR